MGEWGDERENGNYEGESERRWTGGDKKQKKWGRRMVIEKKIMRNCVDIEVISTWERKNKERCKVVKFEK